MQNEFLPPGKISHRRGMKACLGPGFVFREIDRLVDLTGRARTKWLWSHNGAVKKLRMEYSGWRLNFDPLILYRGLLRDFCFIRVPTFAVKKYM